jgi:putative ABC transport system permease protein
MIGELERSLAALPGVRSAGAVSNLPLATGLGDLNFEIEGRPVPEDERSPYADWQVATAGYQAAIGLEVVRGRWIEPGDLASAPGVVVISEVTADRYWPDEDPIGRRFKLGGEAGPGWVTVVGIVRDVRHDALGARPNPQMYLSHAQFRFWGSGEPVRSLTVVLRAGSSPLTLAPQVRQVVRGLDSELPVFRVQTMEQVLARSVSRARVLAALLAGFSVIALVLAAVGVYGVIAHTVAERRRELAIRVALGARAGQVVWPVVGRGSVLVGAGLAAGAAVTVVAVQGIRAQLYGVRPLDVASLLVVGLGIAAVGLVATWLPARRAAAVDPAIPLRSD